MRSEVLTLKKHMHRDGLSPDDSFRFVFIVGHNINGASGQFDIEDLEDGGEGRHIPGYRNGKYL